MIKRPVMRYHGGKFRLASKIITHFPPHRVYVEPFGGAASVLLKKERSYAEVYNDLWDDVVNVFRVLRDPEQAAELELLIRLTPFARDELVACREHSECAVEQARRTIFMSFAGFGSAAANPGYFTGFRANSNLSGSTPAQDWMRYPDHLKTFHERLQGVVIENKGAADVIRQHDSPETLIFADPPYVHKTRSSKLRRARMPYLNEMTDDDHRELATVLRSVQGMVILCSYHCDLYDKELYPDWRQVEIKAFADGARPRTEVLYFSPNCPEVTK